MPGESKLPELKTDNAIGANRIDQVGAALGPEGELGGHTDQLSLRFSSTRRGAHLARQLAVQQLIEWTDLPYDSDGLCAVGHVASELASNAVKHGSLPRRDFRLTVFLLSRNMVHIEVTDTRPERQPPCRSFESDVMSSDTESGRGLLIVDAYAARWGCVVRDTWTKTVWAQVSLSAESE